MFRYYSNTIRHVTLQDGSLYIPGIQISLSLLKEAAMSFTAQHFADTSKGFIVRPHDAAQM